VNEKEKIVCSSARLLQALDPATPRLLPPLPPERPQTQRESKGPRVSTMAFFSTASTAFRFGAVSGATAVLLGAFGAHALAKVNPDPKAMETWKTAAQYHLAHSVALLAASGHRSRLPAALFAGGILVFSGSLYLLVLSEKKWLGAITPIGGLLLTGGWLALLL
jgi:uncharacterized membrane protein YgdD (TMEM256/DUF423 family)